MPISRFPSLSAVCEHATRRAHIHQLQVPRPALQSGIILLSRCSFAPFLNCQTPCMLYHLCNYHPIQNHPIALPFGVACEPLAHTLVMPNPTCAGFDCATTFYPVQLRHCIFCILRVILGPRSPVHVLGHRHLFRDRLHVLGHLRGHLPFHHGHHQQPLSSLCS